MTILYLGIFAASLLLSFVLTKYVRDAAIARGWVVAPALDRHLHLRPLPRLGGVAIFLAFLLSLSVGLLISFLRPAWGLGAPAFKSLGSILLPGFVIFLLGVRDDIRPLSPYVKFAIQAIAGAMLYAFGLQILNLPLLFGHHHFPWFLSLPLTIIWVLAITNAFNLIDGLDGLAAGSALFSTLVVFVVSMFSQSPMISLMALALAGSILGFLRFNFNPATIFLGDCGSLFIGFVLSALALRGAQKAPTVIAVAIPVVSFGLPILETSLSILRRLISGRPVFTADREHIHHKLLARGLSHRQVVIVLYAVSAVFALLSLFLLWPTGSTLGLVMAVLGCGIWLGVQHLGYLEFGELRRVAQRTMEQRQIFVNNLAIRRAVEELKVSADFEQLCCVLVAAFSNNDFDAFEVGGNDLSGKMPNIHGLHRVRDSSGKQRLLWCRPGTYFSFEEGGAWNLTMNLTTGGNRRCGSLTVHRLDTGRDLQLDVNLLTSLFSPSLADALDRTLSQSTHSAPVASDDAEAMAAQAG